MGVWCNRHSTLGTVSNVMGVTLPIIANNWISQPTCDHSIRETAVQVRSPSAHSDNGAS